MFLPQETVLHELFQHVFFTQDAVLQERTAPVWVPQGPQVSPLNLPGACSSTGSPWAAASFKPHPWAPAWGSHGSCLDICSVVVLHGLQRSNMCHHGLQGNLYSSTCSIFSPSILTDIGARRAASHFLTPLSQLLPTFFYPSLNVLPCHDHC